MILVAVATVYGSGVIAYWLAAGLAYGHHKGMGKGNGDIPTWCSWEDCPAPVLNALGWFVIVPVLLTMRAGKKHGQNIRAQLRAQDQEEQRTASERAEVERMLRQERVQTMALTRRVELGMPPAGAADTIQTEPADEVDVSG